MPEFNTLSDATYGEGDTLFRDSDGNFKRLATAEIRRGNAREYAAQYSRAWTSGFPTLQHFPTQPGGTDERTVNILNFLDETFRSGTADAGMPIEIYTAADGDKYFRFTTPVEERVNIWLGVSIELDSPPFDKSLMLHIARGAVGRQNVEVPNSGYFVEDRSASQLLQSFSSVSRGIAVMQLFTFAQGLSDPYYQTPGGFGIVCENVSATNSYNFKRIKLDLRWTRAQS